MKTHFSSSVVTLFIGLGLMVVAAPSGRAATPSGSNTVIANSGSFDSNTTLANISSTDLLESGSTSLSSVVVNNPPDPSYGTTGGLNDGTHINDGDTNFAGSAYYGYNSSANGGAPKANLLVDNQLAGSGQIITFNLNTNALTGGSATGYTLSGINTFAGWQDHPSVADQNYTITYTLVGVPGSFTLGSVAYNPYDPSNDPLSGAGPGYASEVSWSGVSLVGVSSITFDFTADPASSGYGQSGTGLWLEEIDAFGTGTVVPEPGTWAMIGLGLGALVLVARLRFARA